MVLNDEQKLGLYVALPIYFAMFFTMGILGWRAKKSRASAKPAEEANGDGEMENHFVAGKSLGTFVTVMTIFASLFSGYTMVGVPNEAFRNGFTALRWIPSKLFMAFGYMGTSPRLRRISLIRHYHSPLDFITDRFRSQLLRYVLFCVLLVPSIIYLAAQPITLKGNFNDLFGLEDNNVIAPVAICAFILALEWIGGLNVVAYTDAAQGILMILAFVLMSTTLAAVYGGYGSDVFNPTTYPEPKFFQVPSAETQFAMWTFSLQWISFLALPHFQQRTYASGNFKSMKLAYGVITLAPWLTMMVGVFSGTIGVWLLQDESNVVNPFTAIVAKLMSASAFGYISGLLILVGSIAAIISTADSLLIATAHMIMSEVVCVAFPNASQARVAFGSKVVSFLVMALALVVALTDDGALSDLANVQNGMTLQAVPTFLIGLFATPRFTPHAWVLALGAAVGFITTVVINYTYNENEDNYFMNAGVWGLCHNLLIMATIEPILRVCGGLKWSLPKWDMPNCASYGDMPITYDWVNGLMRNVQEPFKSEWFVGVFLVTSVLLLPCNSAGLPELGAQAADGTYPDFTPTTVGGLPDWVFKLIMGSVVLSFTLLWGISKLPSDLDDLSDLQDDSEYLPKRKGKTSASTDKSPPPSSLSVTVPEVSRVATTDEML